MRVLFVSSGNAKTESGLSPIIIAQGDSLREIGLDVQYYGIKGKGIKGYLAAVKPLKEFIENGEFDIIHAHYSLSAYAVSLAGTGLPIVVSLMGSDVLEKGWKKHVTAFFYRRVWSKTIVKSEDMATKSGLRNIVIQPNGVDLNRFQPLNPSTSRSELGWAEDNLHILFGSNPKRPEKNYSLFEEALSTINLERQIEVHPLIGYAHSDIPKVINAAHIAVLSSKWEGSPNFIKESMACNTVTVSTLVGDVEWLFGNATSGCFGASLDLEDYSEALKKAIQFAFNDRKPEGRKRIEELELDHTQVAKNLKSFYDEAIKKNTKS